MHLIGTRRPLRHFLAAAIVAAAAHAAVAQIATVDASDPTSPTITYDQDPQVYLPAIPDDFLTLYYPSPTDSASAAVSAVEAQNAVAVAAIALGYSGVVTSTATVETDPYTSQEPVVTTSQPDTYTLGSPGVYYVDPPAPDGPYNNSARSHFYFDFGPAGTPAADGYTLVTPNTAYGPATGFGWADPSQVTAGDNGGSNPVARTYCNPAHGRAGTLDQAVVSPTPFYVDVPNGTYKVTVATAPDKAGDTARLSVWANGAPQIVLSSKSLTGVTGSFTINVYDGRLCVEFFNALDKLATADPNTWSVVSALSVERIPDDPNRIPTIFVASDSTAASYPMSIYPLTGWGARLDRFLSTDVKVEDDAVAGASSKSFYEHRWLKMIENRIHPGDFLFVMFDINDSADDNSKRKTSAGTTYKAYLRQYVKAARDHGATPVFVTCQIKRTYDAWGRFYNSVQGYPQAQRELGTELNVPVLDLNKMSIDYLNAVGVEASAGVYMFFPAGMYPGWPKGDSDYIHLQDNGATQYAHLITQAIRDINFEPLTKYVLDQPRQ